FDEYELYLAVENIDHSRTKARHPQTNGICECFHRTIQEEVLRHRVSQETVHQPVHRAGICRSRSYGFISTKGRLAGGEFCAGFFEPDRALAVWPHDEWLRPKECMQARLLNSHIAA